MKYSLLFLILTLFSCNTYRVNQLQNYPQNDFSTSKITLDEFKNYIIIKNNFPNEVPNLHTKISQSVWSLFSRKDVNINEIELMDTDYNSEIINFMKQDTIYDYAIIVETKIIPYQKFYQYFNKRERNVLEETGKSGYTITLQMLDMKTRNMLFTSEKSYELNNATNQEFITGYEENSFINRFSEMFYQLKNKIE